MRTSTLRFCIAFATPLLVSAVSSAQLAPPPADYGTLHNVVTSSLLEEACEHLELDPDPDQRQRARLVHDEYDRRVLKLGHRLREACDSAGEAERRRLSSELDERTLRRESLRPSQDAALAAQVQRLSDLRYEVMVVRHRHLDECDAHTNGFLAKLAVIVPLSDTQAADLTRFVRRKVFLRSAAGGEGDLRLKIDLLEEFDRAIDSGGPLSMLALNVEAMAHLEDAALRYELGLDHLLQGVHARLRQPPQWILVVSYEPDFDDPKFLDRRRDAARRSQQLITVQKTFISEVASIAAEFGEAEIAEAWAKSMQAILYPAFQSSYFPYHLHKWMLENLDLSAQQAAGIEAIYGELELERDSLRPRIFDAAIAVASDGEARFGPQPPVHRLNCDLARHLAEFHRTGARALTAILDALGPEQRLALAEYLRANMNRQPPFGPFMDRRTVEAIAALDEMAFNLPDR